jgi:histidinol-phosphate aminotransferase
LDIAWSLRHHPLCPRFQEKHRVIAFTDIVSGLPATTPFVGPETLERRAGEPFRLRLGANESNFGVSPAARAAMVAAIDNAAWYGDPEGFELREALARHHGVAIEQVVLGAGIDELLGVLVRLLVTPGTPVVTSLGAYPTFSYHVAGFGGELVTVPYRDDHEDLQGLASAAARHRAPLVYLSNPDNPMGTWHDAERIVEFVAALPSSTLLVLDEAYAEFAPASAIPPLALDTPRVVRMRTFSKAHGMAGMRIGYALAHEEVVQAFNKVRNHFGVNRIAQAGALASLADTDFSRSVAEEVVRGREDYARLARELGLTPVPSATNFVSIDLGGDGERARAMVQALADEGVFIRMPGVAPLDRCIRVSVGRPEEREAFAAIFRQLLQR